ncbi:MAG: hypothetical protein WDN69_31500 [Aliidongia sp.]
MRPVTRSLLAAGLLLLSLAGCDRTPPQPKFFADSNPEKLSDWGVVVAAGGRLSFGTGVVPYDLATPLFSDYAGKLRTIYLPKGTKADYRLLDAFDFPVGTIVSKTFLLSGARWGRQDRRPCPPGDRRGYPDRRRRARPQGHTAG